MDEIETIVAEPVEAPVKRPARLVLPEEEQVLKMRKASSLAGWFSLGLVVVLMALGLFVPVALRRITYWHVWLSMAAEAGAFGFYRLFCWICEDVLK